MRNPFFFVMCQPAVNGANGLSCTASCKCSSGRNYRAGFIERNIMHPNKFVSIARRKIHLAAAFLLLSSWFAVGPAAAQTWKSHLSADEPEALTGTIVRHATARKATAMASEISYSNLHRKISPLKKRGKSCRAPT